MIFDIVVSARLSTHTSFGIGEKRNAYRILARKPEGSPISRPRHRRCMDNIKVGLRGIGSGVMDWIDLAQERGQWRALMNTVTSFGV
jgi:hypothetical protein